MKAKKLLTIATIMLVILSGVFFFSSRSKAAQGYSSGVYWNYEVSNGEATLVSIYNTNSQYIPNKTLVIPETIGGYPVVQVGNGSNVLGSYKSYFEHIQWPQNSQVRTIGDKAFQSSRFKEIIVPDGVTKVGKNAFSSSTSATSIDLGNTLQYIDEYAFYQIGSSMGGRVMENVVIPDSVTTIKNNAFHLTPIKNLTIGNGVQTIEKETFMYGEVENVTFGSNVTTIGESAFKRCALSTVTIPNTVTSIGNFAFEENRSGDNASLTSVTIGNSVATIGEKAFYNNALTSVTIPNSVTSIGVSAFDTNKISSITFGTGLTAIPELGFAHNELTTLNIPAIIKSIGKDAFRYNKLTSLTLNEGLQTIGENAFVAQYNGDIDGPDPDYNQIAGTLNIPSTVTSIGNNAFWGNKIKTLNFGSSNPTIGDYAFQRNEMENLDLGTALQSTGGRKVFADNNISNINFGNIKTISNSAFTSGLGEIDLVIPGTVETIGNSAFERNSGIKSLTLNEGTKTIDAYAFYYDSNCKGDLTIPNSVTTLGSYAFAYMDNMDGVITVGTGLTSLPGDTFRDMKKAVRFNIPSTVTRMSSSDFDYSNGSSDDPLLSGDIFIDNTPENVTFYYMNSVKRYIHWRNETHHMEINVLPGVHVINAATEQELTSGDYACDSDIDIKLVIDDGYSYDDIKLIVEEGNDFDTMNVYPVDTTETYDLIPLLRDRRITVQNISSDYDLVLRTFIAKVNGANLDESRETVAELENGAIAYKHTKTPVVVKKDDVVTYKIRVYNEGLTDGRADKVNVFLPEGLELISSNLSNIANGWAKDQNDSSKISTSLIANRTIRGYDGRGVVDYKELTLVLKVTKDRVNEVKTTLNMIAEIGESSCDIQGVTDADSTPGSITAAVGEDYKAREAAASTSESYVLGQEDDDDFESVYLPGKVKITYDLHLRKVDIADEQLLEGATFRLYNERKEKITDAITDENGEINFGTMTSYGEGQDIYYMEEIVPPAGYAEKELCKIKIIVNKNLINEATGECAIDVVCEKVDYRVDTSRYQFVPVTSKAELKKIGSGETLTIDGKEYVYAADANYKLMNNIDLSGEEWTPIENEIVGIFDGNGKTISGLTITSTEDYDKSEVGLFRVFSGIFENTTFTDVNISINNFANDADNISGKTGVGTIAGVMREGVIYNVTISGTVTGTDVDNVGGFVGHTMPEKIVRAISCTNNAQVTGKKNVGGVIGCSLGAVSVVNSTNTGAIVETYSYGNAGGFVGYVEATDYQETLFTAAYKDDDNEFTLVARNEELEDGTYTLKLENRDKTTRNLIPNGVYTVYGSDKNAISGLENITLTDGTANLGSYTFNTVGKDTYYLKEVSPATGYRALSKYIKVVVTRAWDGEEFKYYVTVGDSLLSETEFQNDVPEDSTAEVDPRTGKTNDITEHEDVYWNVNKAEFINCTNTAAIGTAQSCQAGGILGTAVKCHAEFENCSNSGTITGTKVAGIAAYITCYKDSDGTVKKDLYNWSKIINCTNTGVIDQKTGVGYAAGGLAGDVVGNIKVYNSTNNGTVTTERGFVGGILGKVSGKTNVANCQNNGELTALEKNNNSVVGGIVGGECVSTQRYYDYSETELIIEDCTNTASLTSGYHVGGIAGMTNSDVCIINNCKVENDEDDIELISQKTNIGGIVCMIYSKNTTITNCDVDDVDMILTGCDGTAGKVGGIASTIKTLTGSDNYNIQKYLLIDNCNVTDCNIDARYDEYFYLGQTSFAGIMAEISSGISSYDSIDPFLFKGYISNCTVKDTDVINRKNQSNANSLNTAGILGFTYASQIGQQYIELSDCLIDGCTIKTTNDNLPSSGSDATQQDTAGIMGHTQSQDLVIRNCDIKDTIIQQEQNPSYLYGCGGDNVAGVLCCSTGSAGRVTITDCDIYDGSEVNATVGGNVGGIYACPLNGPVVIERCTFKDSDIHSKKTNGQEFATACIVGHSNTTISIRDCEVDNVNIESEHCNVGGIVGHTQHIKELDNCSVNRLKITHNYSLGYNGGTVGGLAGYLEGENVTNCRVTNSNLKATNRCTLNAGLIGQTELNVDNCSVSNVTVETDESNTSYEYYNQFIAAGLVGFNQGTITNCSVDDATIKGTTVVTGLVGINLGSVTDCTVDDVVLTGNNIRAEKANGNRVVAGAFGYTSAAVKNIDVDGVTATGNIETFGGFAGTIASDVENVSVKDLDVNISNVKSTSWGAVAGFAGCISSSATLKNVSVEDSELKTDEHIVAGLVGSLSGYYGSMTATIDGATVDNVKLTHENSKVGDFDGLVGGLIGINPTRSTLIVKDANVTDCELVGNSPSGSTSILHVGGLIAFVDGDNSFTNCNVTGTTVTNNTEGMTGGAAGMTQYKENDSTVTERTLVINNVTVDGGNDTVTITGKSHVGGILGFGKFDITTPVEVKNLVLKTLGITGDEEVNAVIGVHTDATGMSDVTVTNVTIQN